MALRTTSFLAAIAAVVSTAGFASAAVVFSDNFERANPGNHLPANGTLVSAWGTSTGVNPQPYVVSTQGASQAQQHTVEPVTGAMSGGQLTSTVGVLRNGLVQSTYNFHNDAAIVAAGGYTVAFDFQRSANGGFVGVFFGLSPDQVSGQVYAGAPFAPYGGAPPAVDGVLAADSEAGYLFQNNSGVGRVQRHTKGADPVNVDGPPAPFDDEFFNTVGVHNAVITVAAPSGFGASSPLIYTLSIDGVAVPGAAVNTTSDGGFGGIGFSSNVAAAFVDNIVVTAVPEPTTLATLAGVGLMFLRRRR
ncbi:MAG TPA: PEP-CTERM sorting domain-containing protein [Tepidisphaeraceae bacterium]|jgi:hypothetical protein|nr:PEP-CTERM sorting domain-containing protein [Tepidisphaeraceae bacterium]